MRIIVPFFKHFDGRKKTRVATERKARLTSTVEVQIKAEGGRRVGYKDLRDFLRVVDKHGELKRLNGVDWDLEMGTLTQ